MRLEDIQLSQRAMDYIRSEAEANGVSVDALICAYKAMASANFEQDIDDLTEELSNED